MKCFDLQINGAYGVEFSSADLTEPLFLQTVERILNAGVTRFLPTLITSPMAIFKRNLELMSRAIEQHQLSYEVPGFHLEGPFISTQPGAVGAHNPKFIVEPSAEIIRQLNDWANGQIRLLTCAAEIAGINTLTDECRRLGITVSLGHQMASSEAIASAHASAMTHLGNALPNLINRHHNPIWSGLANDDLTVMMIADGHHLSKEMLKCFIRCKGTDKLIVVSDASGAAGLPPGEYNMLGNAAVLEADGKFWNPIANHLVGSARLLPECIAFLQQNQLATDRAIRQMVWANPHKLIGLKA